MAEIEILQHTGSGYNPFLITKNWQVAQLNYQPEQALKNITKLERHMRTDEVFILVKGRARLIDGGDGETPVKHRMLPMKKGLVYKVPAGFWHNIVMSKKAKVLIVEESNTHVNDVSYYPL